MLKLKGGKYCKNSGNNLLITDKDDNDFYYSYNTLIAFFHLSSSTFAIRENDWSVTTGKHLDAIDKDKTKRISGVEFEKLYNKLFWR